MPGQRRHLHGAQHVVIFERAVGAYRPEVRHLCRSRRAAGAPLPISCGAPPTKTPASRLPPRPAARPPGNRGTAGSLPGEAPEPRIQAFDSVELGHQRTGRRSAANTPDAGPALARSSSLVSIENTASAPPPPARRAYELRLRFQRTRSSVRLDTVTAWPLRRKLRIMP